MRSRPVTRRLRASAGRCSASSACSGSWSSGRLIPTLGLIDPQYLPYVTDVLARLAEQVRRPGVLAAARAAP